METACPATQTRKPRSVGAGHSPLPGHDRFAHFEILHGECGALECLGQGGMGSTFLAFDTQLQREVALKVIHPERLHDPEARSRFLREARAAARLQHPNIASILYQGEENGACFYAMELVTGEDLRNYIERVGPIAPVHALRICKDVALALDAAFQQKILHRDLKPANVMLTSYHAGGALHVKVIDFGLAKVISDQTSTLMTQGFLGTPEFASPEQCEEKVLDVRSDLYSLGATLWYLLTGNAPFRGSFYSILRAQVTAPPPIETLTDAPAPLVALLKRLLAKDPADRPATPLEAAREIDAALEALAKDPAHLRPLVLTSPAAAGLPVASGASPSRGGIESQPKSDFASKAHLDQRVPQSSRRTMAIIAGAIVVVAAAWIPFTLLLRSKSSKPGTAAAEFAERARESSVADAAEAVDAKRANRPPVSSGVSAGVQAPPIAPPPPPVPQGGRNELVNRLGMRFIPVEGTNLRASIWETRVRDFQAFAAATGMAPVKSPAGGTWENPGFPQDPDHPVVNVSWEEAVQFCAWLTKEDRAAGTITASQAYRLPGRFEWDAIAGHAPPEHRPRGSEEPEFEIDGPRRENRPPNRGPKFGPGAGPRPPGPGEGPGPRPAIGPEPRAMAGNGPPYNWGDHVFPPMPGVGNFADITAAGAKSVPVSIAGYNDGFAHTAPAGRFRASRTGLHDVSGNVWEMCEERGRGTPQLGMQGGGWSSAEAGHFLMHALVPIQPKQREVHLGFRCVLE